MFLLVTMTVVNCIMAFLWIVSMSIYDGDNNFAVKFIDAQIIVLIANIAMLWFIHRFP